jgi:hypothetical protein
MVREQGTIWFTPGQLRNADLLWPDAKSTLCGLPVTRRVEVFTRLRRRAESAGGGTGWPRGKRAGAGQVGIPGGSAPARRPGLGP